MRLSHNREVSLVALLAGPPVVNKAVANWHHHSRRLRPVKLILIIRDHPALGQGGWGLKNLHIILHS